MPGPPPVFERQVKVFLTADQIARAKHRAAMRGVTFSELLRQALDRELNRPTPERTAKRG